MRLLNCFKDTDCPVKAEYPRLRSKMYSFRRYRSNYPAILYAGSQRDFSKIVNPSTPTLKLSVLSYFC